MSDKDAIKLFENQKIRSVWKEDEEEWYFSVVDVVGALTDSVDPREYLKKMRRRDAELDFYIGINCPHVEMTTGSNKKRKLLSVNIKQLLRIIQSIPSKKAEPFKLWLAEVGKERIDETINPELLIERAVETYPSFQIWTDRPLRFMITSLRGGRYRTTLPCFFHSL